ncbi:hypothetical protein [Mesorhizobium temperatum]|uniref:hypothetical protein n=1 Tax=Mesorhizobium temperatum TaxID=241416 RepID=UPI00117D1F2E|nr:hypothetical protein [Mesorhizobium temperatum]
MYIQNLPAETLAKSTKCICSRIVQQRVAAIVFIVVCAISIFGPLSTVAAEEISPDSAVCIDISPMDISKLVHDVDMYFSGKETPNQIYNKYIDNNVYYSIILYLVMFSEKSDKNGIDEKSLEKDGWPEVYAHLRLVLNMALFESSENNADYIDVYIAHRSNGLFNCIIDQEDPLLNSVDVRLLRYDESNFPERAEYIEKLRYAAQISNRLMELYISILNNVGAFSFNFEKEYWNRKANICDSGANKIDCLKQIRSYIREDREAVSHRSQRELTCVVGVAGSDGVYRARLCQ